jgi:hypothetical protein
LTNSCQKTRQVLEEKNFHTDRESADKDTVAYDTLVELIMTANPAAGNLRIDFYNFELFIWEMRELRLINGKKYDHPRKFANGHRGSKDVADAVACATKRAIRWHLEFGMEPPGNLLVIPAKPLLPKFGDERSAF